MMPRSEKRTKLTPKTFRNRAANSSDDEMPTTRLPAKVKSLAFTQVTLNIKDLHFKDVTVIYRKPPKRSNNVKRGKRPSPRVMLTPRVTPTLPINHQKRKPNNHSKKVFRYTFKFLILFKKSKQNHSTAKRNEKGQRKRQNKR